MAFQGVVITRSTWTQTVSISGNTIAFHQKGKWSFTTMDLNVIEIFQNVICFVLICVSKGNINDILCV